MKRAYIPTKAIKRDITTNHRMIIERLRLGYDINALFGTYYDDWNQVWHVIYKPLGTALGQTRTRKEAALVAFSVLPYYMQQYHVDQWNHVNWDSEEAKQHILDTMHDLHYSRITVEFP